MFSYLKKHIYQIKKTRNNINYFLKVVIEIKQETEQTWTLS